MENKKHSYWETTSADVERVKDRLMNVVASLEDAAVELKNISAKRGFIFKYSGGGKNNGLCWNSRKHSLKY